MNDDRLHQEFEEQEARQRRVTYRATVLGMLASIAVMLGIVGPAVTWLARPALLSLLSDVVRAEVQSSMSEEIDDQLQKKVAPLNVGFKAILQQNVNRLKREIAELKRRDRMEGLTEVETRTLTDKQIDLEGQQAALKAIKAAEREEH